MKNNCHIPWKVAGAKGCLVAAVLGIAIVIGASADAQINDNTFIENLLQQQAYEKIDEHCREQLANETLPDDAAVDIVVAWLRATTHRALEAEPGKRNEHWKRLGEISTVSRSALGSPRRILIRIQLALAGLARAELSRRESLHDTEAVGTNLESTRVLVRSTVAELKKIDASLQKILTSVYQLSASKARETGWTRIELETLRRHLAVELARAYHTQALCYPSASPDHANSLILALESLENLTKTASDGDVLRNARLEQISCLRLLKRFAEARQLLDLWRHELPETEFAEAFHNEELQLAIATGNLEQMLTHETSEDTPDRLLQAAAGLYTSGQIQDAIAAYDRAAELFDAAGDKSRQFSTALSAAAIVRKAGKREAALRRFRKLALEQSDNSRAAAAHFVAIGLAVSITRDADETARTAAIERYVALLHEHLDQWPNGTESRKVRLWLLQFQMSQREWSQAADLLTEGKVLDVSPEAYASVAEELIREDRHEQAVRVVDAAKRIDLGLELRTADELDRYKADALSALGQRDDALKLYKALVDRVADDGEIHESYATLLAHSDSTEDLGAALRVWQRIDKRSKPEEARWLRARQARLDLLVRLEMEQQAVKLWQVTELLYPQSAGKLMLHLPTPIE